MARIIRPVWAIRCSNSACKNLFEVVRIEEENKTQEVICPGCGEHYVYPPPKDDNN